MHRAAARLLRLASAASAGLLLVAMGAGLSSLRIPFAGWPCALLATALISAAGFAFPTVRLMAVLAHRGPPALVGAGVAAVQVHYFGIDSTAAMADWTIVSALVFAGLRSASLALLMAACGIVVSRLPGLAPELGLVVCAAGLLGLCVFQDAVNALMPALPEPQRARLPSPRWHGPPEVTLRSVQPVQTPRPSSEHQGPQQG